MLADPNVNGGGSRQDQEKDRMKPEAAMPRRSYLLPLPPHKIASRQAHRVLEWALRDWALDGDLADDARVVLSELVTNALTHSLDVFRLTLRLHGERLLIEVWDAADGMPRVGVPEDLAVNGRGMFLVDALSRRWGVRAEPDGGKTVWAELTP
jgi:anti-sigma regulatory factor (Ser/Thr protein kinase)